MKVPPDEHATRKGIILTEASASPTIFAKAMEFLLIYQHAESRDSLEQIRQPTTNNLNKLEEQSCRLLKS